MSKSTKKQGDENPFEAAESPVSVEISKESAEKILQSDFDNINKKVKAGKTLTAQERVLIQQIAEGAKTDAAIPSFADNQSHLASLLDVTRKTIQRWLKEDGNPGAEENGKYNVLKWREFAKTKGYEFTDDLGGSGQASAKAQQILLQNEKLRDKILKDRGELLPRVLAKQVFSKLLLSAKSRTFTSINRIVMLARMAPDTASASEEIQKELTAIWKALEDSKWLN